MSTAKSPVSLLSGAWDTQLGELLDASQHHLFLASPFITRQAMSCVGERLAKNSFAQNLQIVCLTNLKIESVLSGSLELEGIIELSRGFPQLSLFHLPSLHAKVFIADNNRAIITSGNLTNGGLTRNCEYGVALTSTRLVSEVRRDFEGYVRLGAHVTVSELEELSDDLSGLRRTYQRQIRQFTKEISVKLRHELKTAEDRVLQFRARSKTTHGIFRETILHLLVKSPLKTSELHPIIQQIHPDLCDDNVERVIDGVNFGKKWKHYVRNAQQTLKREGLAAYDGERWYLTKS